MSKYVETPCDVCCNEDPSICVCADNLGCPYTFLTRCNEPTGKETFCPKHAKCDCGYPMSHNGDCDPQYLDWVDGWNSGYMAGEY